MLIYIQFTSDRAFSPGWAAREEMGDDGWVAARP